MKKSVLNKIIFILLSVMFVLVLMTIQSNAASISISTSKSSVSPGGTFSVTVSVSGGAGKVSTTVSNGSGGKTEFLDNGSYSFTCTAGSSGSVTISASGSIADYDTETESTKSASKTVTIVQPSTNTGGTSGGSSTSSGNNNSSGGGSSTSKKPTTNTTTTTPKEEVKKSTDNTLRALSIEEGTITPEFNKDVREYAITIPYEVAEVNVTATPNDSKASVAIEGNKDLKEGENTVTVKVTAEDGSESKYLIRVTRARIPLALNSLIVKYQNQEGGLVELPLNPALAFNTLEYTMQDLDYWVEKLIIEATPNIEGATIDIQGADTLQTGENTITITLKIPQENTPEGEEPKEETITYTIKLNRLEEPTLFVKIQDWFKGIMGTVGTWFNNNQSKVIVGALALCIVALIGLSIYIVIDYNKYKEVIVKVKKVSQMNANSQMVEEIEQSSNIIEDISQENSKEDRPKGGKHF